MPLTRLKAARFQTKVLVPVVLVMVLLVAVTMVVVNHRLTAQFHHEARQALQTADAVFKKSQRDRQGTLQIRRESIPNVPHFRAVFLKKDPRTIAELLDKSVDEIRGDLVTFTTAEGETIATSQRDPSLNVAEFQKNSAPALQRALQGMPAVDTIRISDQLLDVVSLPVPLPNGELVGVLTFCSKFGSAEADSLSETTGCGIVLIANNRVVASSLGSQDLLQQCVDLFGTIASASGQDKNGGPARMKEIVSPRQSYLPRIGIFDSLSGDPKLGYVLLYSSFGLAEELRATQQSLVICSLVGILFATAIVWFLIRQTTRP
jgi:hypothetical protein